MQTLGELGLAENTVLIFSSDNGGVGGYEREGLGIADITDNAPLRHGKGSLYEGGTRVPFIVRWPGRIKPGASGELICHVDMLATMAALTGQKLVDAAGPDSFNVLAALLGEKRDKPCRDHLIEHGNVLAIRKGPWKLIPGNPSAAGAKRNKKAGGRSDELYNLAEDIGEMNNVAAAHPELVKEMAGILQRVREDGRSRP
jgi:arylsulfatase A-like enzyme